MVSISFFVSDKFNFGNTSDSGKNILLKIPPNFFLSQNTSILSPTVKIIAQYVNPATVGAGLLLNILSVIMMQRRNLRKKVMSVYFTALGVADFLHLLVTMLFGPVGERNSIDMRTRSRSICALATFLIDFCNVFPSAVLVVIAVTRAVAVLLPFRAQRVNNIKFSRRIVACLFLGTFVMHLYLLWSADLVTLPDGQSFCSLFNSYPFYEIHVRMWLMSALSSYFPLAILLACNISILVKIRKLSQTRAKMMNIAVNTNKQDGTLTASAVAVCFVFAGLTVTMTLLGTLAPWMPEEVGWISREVGVLLGLISHSINFFLYICSSKEARNEIVTFFCYWCRRNN